MQTLPGGDFLTFNFMTFVAKITWKQLNADRILKMCCNNIGVYTLTMMVIMSWAQLVLLISKSMSAALNKCRLQMHYEKTCKLSTCRRSLKTISLQMSTLHELIGQPFSCLSCAFWHCIFLTMGHICKSNFIISTTISLQYFSLDITTILRRITDS